MNKKEIEYFLNNNPFLFMSLDDNLLYLSTKLIIEINELLDNGYSYFEVEKLICECDFENENLNIDEIDFLKRDAQRSLKIIYKRR